MSQLMDLPLVELSQRIRRREVACRDVMQAHLDRVDAANPTHNAIVSRREPAVLLAEAAQRDQELAAGNWRGVLHGIPQAIKDLASTRGLRTTLGSPILADQVPVVDALFVQRMRAAGAILVGKTNTPEFGLGSHTFNEVHGVTRNAHDPALTAGGSSGGAAVALALGMLPVADGSDMMGSLRNPAAFNRVIGLRPTRGRVPRWPALDSFFVQLATDGPMARNARDCALLLSVQAGHDRRDPLSIHQDGAAFSALAAQDDGYLVQAARGRRIGWFGNLGGHLATEPGVLQRCEAGLRQLAALGCIIEPLRPDALGAPPEALWNCWVTLRSIAAAPALFGYSQDPARRAQMKPEAIWEADRGLTLSAAEVARASQTRTAFYQAWVRLFEQVDVVALPSAQVFPFPVELRWPDRIDGRAMDTYHRWMETVIYATLAGSPAISVPVPQAASGAPVRTDLMGLQLIGAPGDDAGVLGLAAAYEAAA